MNLRDLTVHECELKAITEFFEKHHYSKSVRGVTPSYCFKVMHDEILVGAALFGRPAMKQTIEKYSDHGRFKMTELRRLCFIDDTPRNTESYILGKFFKLLSAKGVQRILSYADPNQGHAGTIYKATGFEYLGQTPDIKVVWYRDRRFPYRNIDQYRKWSTRSINRYNNYQNKSKGLFPFAQELREAMANGTAIKRTEAGKFIFLKHLPTRETAVAA